MKKEELSDKILIEYYLEKAKTLAASFEEQEQIAIRLNLGDYYTEDIANDWLDEDLKTLKELSFRQLGNADCALLYDTINKNFKKMSLIKECSKVWSLKSLKDSSFWENQRTLAKRLLYQLEKMHEI